MDANAIPVARREPYRVFLKDFVHLAIPIILQQFIQALVNMTDTIMVGRLGAREIVAVGLGNQIFFMLSMALFGISSGAGIFISQFWGRKEIGRIKETLGIALILSLCISTLVATIAIVRPALLLGLYTRDTAVIDTGRGYLGLVAMSYPVMAVSYALGSALRSCEHVKLPMYATLVSLMLNIVLNYLLIFGVGALPELGVIGAAIATLISRVVEIAILYIGSKCLKVQCIGTIKEYLSFNRGFLYKFIKIALPVIFNETLWGLGISLQNSIYAHAGTDIIAAYNIADTAAQLVRVFFMGMGYASAVILGKKIGEDTREAVILCATRFMIFMPLSSLGLIPILLCVAQLLPRVFLVDPNIVGEAKRILYILASIYPFAVLNMYLVVGLCRSGGDTIFAAAIDIGYMYTVSIPLAMFVAFKLHAPARYIFLSLQSEQVLKALSGIVRFKRGKWLHDLTR